MIAEPSGALAAAAAAAAPREKRVRSVCLVTGGRIDVSTLLAILADE